MAENQTRQPNPKNSLPEVTPEWLIALLRKYGETEENDFGSMPTRPSLPAVEPDDDYYDYPAEESGDSDISDVLDDIGSEMSDMAPAAGLASSVDWGAPPVEQEPPARSSAMDDLLASFGEPDVEEEEAVVPSQEPAAPESEPAPPREPQTQSVVPNWLDDIQDSSEEVVPSPAADKPGTDWLDEFMVETPLPETESDDAPGWLAEFGATEPPADEPEAPAPPPAILTPTSPAMADNIPDWLSDLESSPAPAASTPDESYAAVEETSAADEAPNWLDDLEIKETDAAPDQVTPITLETSPKDDESNWLDNLSFPEQTPPEVPESLESLESPESFDSDWFAQVAAMYPNDPALSEEPAAEMLGLNLTDISDWLEDAETSETPVTETGVLPAILPDWLEDQPEPEPEEDEAEDKTGPSVAAGIVAGAAAAGIAGKILGESDDEETIDAEAPAEPEDTPLSWLDALESDVETEPELPDWMQDIPDTPREAPEEESGPDAPAWLTELPTDEILEPPLETAPIEAEQEAPEPDAPEIPEPALSFDLDTAEDMPEWLADVEQKVETEAKIEPTIIIPDEIKPPVDVPEWLVDLEEGADAEVEALTAEMPITTAEEDAIPAWLDDATPAKETEETEYEALSSPEEDDDTTTAAGIAATAVTAGVAGKIIGDIVSDNEEITPTESEEGVDEPDWFAEMQPISEETPEDDARPESTPEAETEIEIPAWMQIEEPVETTIAAEPESAAAPTPVSVEPETTSPVEPTPTIADAGDAIPDWLAEVQAVTGIQPAKTPDVEPPAETEEQTTVEIPAWMAAIEPGAEAIAGDKTPVIEELEETPSEEEVELPDWMAGVEQEVEADTAEAGTETPEDQDEEGDAGGAALAAGVAAAVTAGAAGKIISDIISDDDDEDAAESETIADENADDRSPDWFAEMQQEAEAETPAAEETIAEPEPPAWMQDMSQADSEAVPETEVEADTPDWFAEVQQEAEAEAPTAEETIAKPELPDWMAEAQEEVEPETEAEPEAGETDEEESSDTTLAAGLAVAGVTAANILEGLFSDDDSETEETETPPTPESDAEMEMSIPDWMQNIPDSDAEAESPSWILETEDDSETGDTADELPGWMADLSDDETTPPPETPADTADSDDVPGWMADLQETTTPEQPEETDDDIPAWMQDLSAPDETEEAPSEFEMPPDPDADEEDEDKDPPLLAGAAAATAGIAAHATDSLTTDDEADDDKGMAWLDTLQQEPDPDPFEALAGDQATENDIDWLADLQLETPDESEEEEDDDDNDDEQSGDDGGEDDNDDDDDDSGAALIAGLAAGAGAAAAGVAGKAILDAARPEQETGSADDDDENDWLTGLIAGDDTESEAPAPEFHEAEANRIPGLDLEEPEAFDVTAIPTDSQEIFLDQLEAEEETTALPLTPWRGNRFASHREGELKASPPLGGIEGGLFATVSPGADMAISPQGTPGIDAAREFHAIVNPAPPSPAEAEETTVRQAVGARVLRAGLNLLFLVVISIPLFIHYDRGGGYFSIWLEPSEMEQLLIRQELQGVVGSQLPDNVVLVSFDFTPATEGEMMPLAVAVMKKILGQGLRVIAVSLEPEGQAMARAVLAEVTSPEEYGERVINLGYLPGGPIAVRNLTFNNPLANAIDIENGQPYSSLANWPQMESLSEASLFVEIGSNPNTGRWWVEQLQAGGAASELPKFAAVSAAVEPFIRPYAGAGTNQYMGVVAGINGAAALEPNLPQPTLGTATAMLDSLSVASLVIMVLMLLGTVAGLINKYGQASA